MISLSSLTGFALVALGMVLTPGPNMMYLISRSICQGHRAGFLSLAGVATGFLFYLICAALGITTLLFAVPFAYDVLRFGGALYLLYLAWQAVKPKGRSPFEVRDLKPDSDKKLFFMGLMTNLLNPKIAILYLALLPQFIDPSKGSVLQQSFVLGFVQICISVTVNALIVMSAGAVALFLKGRPGWLHFQRWVMGTMLAALAVRMSLQARK
jgi:threonine/homoserine/homoserine lactone efflux protein